MEPLEPGDLDIHALAQAPSASTTAYAFEVSTDAGAAFEQVIDVGTFAVAWVGV